MHRSTIFVPLALLILLIAALACQGATNSKPTVIISSPPSGTTFNSGDDVPVQSTSTDSQGITRVELQVDGIVVRSDPSPVAQGQAQFSLIQTWKAAGAGSHNLIVRAYNTTGSFSDGGIVITVKEAVAAAPTDTPVIATIVPPPTSAPTSTSTSTPSTNAPAPTDTPTQAPAAPTNTATTPPCVPNSQFVADVTIPDGTILLPGAPFVKTWRVKNTGNCAWDNGYAVVFVGGTAFVQGAAPIPNAAPGQIVDISMAMVSPVNFGNYIGLWRIRASNGVFFGTNLTVVISVPNPNPPTATHTNVPTATNTPTQTPTNPPTNTPTLTNTPAPSVTQILKQITIPASSSGQAIASCPGGSKVTGGGFASSTNLRVYSNAPQGNGWESAAKNLTAAPQLLNAYAVCVSNISGTANLVFAQVTVGANTTGQAVVSCPAGTALTGGGYAANDGEEVYSNAGQGNGWESAAKNNTGGGLLLNAYAMCYNGSGANSTQVLQQVTVNGGTTGSASVQCAAGRLVTGGGYAANVGLIVYTISKFGNGWQAFASNTTGTSKLLNSYAICTQF